VRFELRRVQGQDQAVRLSPQDVAVLLRAPVESPAAAAPAAQSGTPATPAAAVAPLRFEVASIKQLQPSGGPMFVALPRLAGQPGGRYTHTGSIRVLFQQAFQMPFVRQVGGPEWTERDIYSITAKVPDDVPMTAENVRQMVRQLLIDRFKLVAREETRELPIYRLVLARDDRRLGANITPVTTDCSGDLARTEPCSRRMMSSRNAVEIRNQPITSLANLLEGITGRPVIESTGLSGTFDLTLNFTPDQQLAAGIESEYPSLFTAIQEQLGLKLEAGREPMPVLVIDSIERPTEN
jgi:uncharacterized protein (TIGR03435 family)